MSDIAGRRSQVDWAAILAGAVLATAIGVILTGFGLGIGLAANSPYEGEGVSPGLFVFGAGLWTLAVQVLAFWVGGYVCARLRTRQTEVSDHEVDVRDSLHGVLVWATGIIAATIITFFVFSGLSSATDSARGGGVVASITQSVDSEVDQAAVAERAKNPEATDEALAERRAEVVRKAGVISSFITAASLLAGAVAAFFAALSGGHHRDKSVQVRFFTVRRAFSVSPTSTPPT
jgi:hypothetical protein